MIPLVAVSAAKYGSRRRFVVATHQKHEFNAVTGYLIPPARVVQQLNQGEDINPCLLIK